MTYASRLLDKVFDDDDADLILGEVVSKPKSATRTLNNTARDNFSDVRLFFKTHGRLPENNDGDLSEHAAWSKLQGIINKPALIAQVRDMDDCNILEFALQRSLDRTSDDSDVRGNLVNALTTASTVSTLHQLAVTVQSILSNATHDLNQLDAWLSKHVSERTFDNVAQEHLNDALLAITTKLQECTHAQTSSIDDTINPTAEFDTDEDASSSEQPPQEEPIDSSSEPTTSLETATTDPEEPLAQSGPCSIEDVFADDDLDDFLGPDEAESAILGGRRATRVFERNTTEQTNRTPCAEFPQYKERFDTYKAALEDGRLVVALKPDDALNPGDIFLWDGLIAILTDKVGDGYVAEHSGERRQVIFSNGTEAWLREGSIKRCMYAYGDRGNKIVCKRLLPVTENIFSVAGTSTAIDVNEVTGHIYVARTLSKDPALSKIKKTAVKIGVTKNPVHLRLAGAENDPTFLFSKADVISTFTLHNLEPRKVEETLHAFFAGARLKIRAKDRFGKDVSATEWFLIQPKLVTQAVEYLMANTLHKYRFNARDGKIELR